MDVLFVNAADAGSVFDGYCGSVSDALAASGRTTKMLRLRDMNIAPCRGCFTCWVKTPGLCVYRDDGDVLCSEFVNSSLVVLAAPLIMGYPASRGKIAFDRIIPVVHPHLEDVDGEAHHKKRYENYPRLGLLLQKESDTDDEDMQIVETIFRRASINMRSSLAFITCSDRGAQEVADEINRC